jgi:hypothetical protein
MSATSLCRGAAATSIRKPPSSLVRVLPVFVACIPKFGCPLCWPALAALCSLCGLPFATLNPLLIGASLLGIALLLISAALQHTFRWPSGLLLAGLFATLGARLLAAPEWVGYVATVLVLTALVAEFSLRRPFARIAFSPHCLHRGQAASVSPRSREEA